MLRGKKGAPRDAVLANAAAGIYVAGMAPTLVDGVQRAAESIDSGAALDRLEKLVRMSAAP